MTEEKDQEEEREWNRKYREYIDNKYLELLRHSLDTPFSKIELLTLGATRVQVGSQELYVITLPFHSDSQFVFKQDDDGNFYKW